MFLCCALLPAVERTCSLCVAIIFLAYALQTKYRPFIESDNEAQLCMNAAGRDGAVNAYFVPFNRLEAGYLITSMLTLLSGMIFQSGSMSVSSGAYLALTVLVRLRCTGQLVMVDHACECLPWCYGGCRWEPCSLAPSPCSWA